MIRTDEIKVKTPTGLYLHQEITKTESQEVKSKIIVKDIIKNKEKFLKKVGQLQKNLKAS